MALSVFPIDGLIPTLVEATDPNQIANLLAEALPEASSGEFLIRDVRLLLAHYGRYKRCVLRYSIDGIQTKTQTSQNITVYGKVDADGLGGLTVDIISALREKLLDPELPYLVPYPHSLGYFPDLHSDDGSPSGTTLFQAIVENLEGNSHSHGSVNGRPRRKIW
jgi:hypothetical protein